MILNRRVVDFRFRFSVPIFGSHFRFWFSIPIFGFHFRFPFLVPIFSSHFRFPFPVPIFSSHFRFRLLSLNTHNLFPWKTIFYYWGTLINMLWGNCPETKLNFHRISTYGKSHRDWRWFELYFDIYVIYWDLQDFVFWCSIGVTDLGKFDLSWAKWALCRSSYKKSFDPRGRKKPP